MVIGVVTAAGIVVLAAAQRAAAADVAAARPDYLVPLLGKFMCLRHRGGRAWTWSGATPAF